MKILRLDLTASSMMIALLCLCAISCGNASSPATGASRATPDAAPSSYRANNDYDPDDYESNHSDGDDDDRRATDRDGDTDNNSGSYYDSDDDSALEFGHAASAATRRTIATLVKRYYAAAAADEGAAACSMIVPSIAKAVPETLGGSAGPPFARGGTCAIIVAKIFKEFHAQLASYAPTLEVTAVRLDQNFGWAVLGFRSLPGRQIPVIRAGGVWKLAAILDRELP